MMTRGNIRFLLIGLALGFLLAIFIFVPEKQEIPAQLAPKMSVVMNVPNGAPLPANKFIIPAATTKEMFPVKLEIRSISTMETPVERALRNAAQQKYHLIYREIPPIE